MHLSRRQKAPLIVVFAIIPIGIFAFVGLNGLFGKSSVQTVMAETVYLEMERPEYFIDVIEGVVNSYSDGNALFISKIKNCEYVHEDPHHGSHDSLLIQLFTDANVSSGFIESVNITFRENSQQTWISIWEKWSFQAGTEDKCENLELKDWASGNDGSWQKLTDELKGFVVLNGVNAPKKVHYWAPCHLIFLSKGTSHELRIEVQFTYNDGSVRKQITLPTVIRMKVDNNNSFNLAQEVEEGNYSLLWINSNSPILPYYPDLVDYYKINLTEGQKISITITPTQYSHFADLDLYLYDSAQNLKCNSTTRDPEGPHTLISESVNFLVQSSPGYYYIKVQAFSCFGFYTLSIKIGE